jgi:hypothetical protein
MKRYKNVEYNKTNIICLNEIKVTDNFENFLAIFLFCVFESFMMRKHLDAHLHLSYKTFYRRKSVVS